MMATPQCTTPTNLTPPEGGWTPTALAAAFGARELRSGEAPAVRLVLEDMSDVDLRRVGALAQPWTLLRTLATALLNERAATRRSDKLDPELAAEVESVLAATSTPVLHAMARAVIRGTDMDRAIERELGRRFEVFCGRDPNRPRTDRVEEL